MQTILVNQPSEQTLTAARSRRDTFNEIEVDVVLRDQADESLVDFDMLQTWRKGDSRRRRASRE